MDWRSLYWPGGVPWWFALLVGLLLAESLRRRHRDLLERLPVRRARTLLVLRGLLYAVIVFFLTGPTLIERSDRALPPKLLVLVDTSASMGVKDEPGAHSRLSAAVDFLLGRGDEPSSLGASAVKAEGTPAEEAKQTKEKKTEEKTASFLERLSRTYDVRLETFESVSAPALRESLPSIKALGRGSDPQRAIRAALASGAGGPSDRLLGVLLLSDGGDTTGSIWPPADAGRYPPVIGVGFGSEERFRDISLHEVRSPRLAFQGKEVRVEVTVSVRGFTGRQLPVALTRDGRVVRAETVDVRRGEARKTVEFRFTPTEVGSQILVVETPVQRGELVESNNRVEIPLEVRRDKIRVLTISGNPSWNYRFLRMALKRDPAIDLVSFVFLRTSDDDPGVPTNELSLVPFPVDKLFLEELKNFDIVVFDNFSAQEYFSNYYLERVGEYVRSGGAFLIFGGRASYGSGGYMRSPIADLLPVRIAEARDFAFGRKIAARLTGTGGRHPIMQLSHDPEVNARIWSAFPPLHRANVTAPWDEGQVLLSSGGQGGGFPLIGARRVGEGRVLSILTDDMWRWNFGMVATERTNQHYLRLVSQMVRWLSGDPANSQVRILPDAEPAKDGQQILRLQVYDDAYEPARAASVRVTLRDPYGAVQRVPAVFRPETGEFEVRFRPGGRGSYRAEVEALLNGRVLGHAVRTVTVGGEAGGAEWADVSPRWDRLRALAQKTGGVFLAANGSGRAGLERRVFEALQGRVPPTVEEIRDVRLWSIPWIGMILILLPAGEWTLRRLWGLA